MSLYNQKRADAARAGDDQGSITTWAKWMRCDKLQNK